MKLSHLGVQADNPAAAPAVAEVVPAGIDTPLEQGDVALGLQLLHPGYTGTFHHRVPTQRIYIYTEVTVAPFVFTKSVFCLRKPEAVLYKQTDTRAPVGSIEKYYTVLCRYFT